MIKRSSIILPSATTAQAASVLKNTTGSRKYVVKRTFHSSCAACISGTMVSFIDDTGKMVSVDSYDVVEA